MPIYEYECSGCHQHFDLMQKISEPPQTQCPNCSQNMLVKLVSPAGFHLKGTGWYATDFKNTTSNKAVPTKDTNKTEDTSSQKQSKADTSSKETKTSVKSTGDD